MEERLVAQTLRKGIAQRLSRPGVVREAEVAADAVLQKTDRGGRDKIVDHVAEDLADGEKSIGCGAHISEAAVVQQYLLHNKGGNGLAKFGSRTHYSQAQRYYLRLEEEVDDLGIVHLYQSPNDTQGRQAEILKGSGFGIGVEEGVEVEGDVGTEEEGSGVLVRGDALEQGQGVANAVRGVRRQSRWREEGVDGNNLLEKSGHGAKGMPKDGGQVFAVFPLFRQFQEDIFALVEMEGTGAHACNAMCEKEKDEQWNSESTIR